MLTALCDTRRPPGRIFLSLAATVAGVIAKDAMNPEGITRKALRAFGDRFAGRLDEPETGRVRRVRTVDAEVLPGPVKPK